LLPVILTMPLSKEHRNLIEQIYDLYYGTMMSVANQILKDQGLSEDAVAEAFVKISRHLDKFDDVSGHRTRGYIVKTVKTISYDLCKKINRRKEEPDDFLELTPDTNINILADLVNQESYDSLKDVIQSLPEHLKDVVFLYAGGYSHEEIGEALGISYANSKQRLSRARKIVKKMWAGEHNGE